MRTLLLYWWAYWHNPSAICGILSFWWFMPFLQRMLKPQQKKLTHLTLNSARSQRVLLTSKTPSHLIKVQALIKNSSWCKLVKPASCNWAKSRSYSRHAAARKHGALTCSWGRQKGRWNTRQERRSTCWFCHLRFLRRTDHSRPDRGWKNKQTAMSAFHTVHSSVQTHLLCYIFTHE